MPNGEHSVMKFDLSTAHGWKDLVFKWLFQQGVSTILLAALLFIMYRGADYIIHDGIPAYTKFVQDGLADQRKDFSEALSNVMATHAKDSAANREFYERLLAEVRANRKALEKLPDSFPMHSKEKEP